jgi:hypothetical protein
MCGYRRIPFDWPRLVVAFIYMSTTAAIIQVLADESQKDAATDWPLDIATLLLFLATAALAYFAFRGLRQLKEVRSDRHTQIVSALLERWSSPAMLEAFELQSHYSDTELRDLFARWDDPRATDLLEEHERVTEERLRQVLIRIPDYFEDAAMLAQSGELNDNAFRNQFGGLAAAYWQRYWHLAVKQMQQSDHEVYELFEELAREETPAGVPGLGRTNASGASW